MQVCGEAEDVSDALSLAKATNPDLVIIDLSLKSGQGLDLIKILKQRLPGIKSLVSSMYDEDLYAERALRAGAHGYLNKQESPDQVIHAIRQVMAGKLFLSAKMTDHLLQRTVGTAKAASFSQIDSLSDRELEVFKLVGKGLTTKQIAKSLHLSVKTIGSHRNNIMRKLEFVDGTELTHKALQWVLENG
jgi:DNA-binding NarL/FixJ family response regulator